MSISLSKIGVIFACYLMTACNNSNNTVLDADLLMRTLNKSIKMAIIEKQNLDIVLKKLMHSPKQIATVKKNLVEIIENGIAQHIFQQFDHEMDFSGKNVLLCEKQEIYLDCKNRLETIVKQQIESYTLGFSQTFMTCQQEAKKINDCMTRQGYAEEMQMMVTQYTLKK